MGDLHSYIMLYTVIYNYPAQGSRIKDQGSRIWWSIENALDLENEVPSAPTRRKTTADLEYSSGIERISAGDISEWIESRHVEEI